LLFVETAVHDLGAADQNAWIDAKRPAEQAEDDDGSYPKSATANRYTHTTTAAKAASLTACVFDIVAAAKIIPTHDGLLQTFVAIIAELRALVQL
jgi:hypothetical protein